MCYSIVQQAGNERIMSGILELHQSVEESEPSSIQVLIHSSFLRSIVRGLLGSKTCTPI